jgi:hypothetical protein
MLNGFGIIILSRLSKRTTQIRRQSRRLETVQSPEMV